MEIQGVTKLILSYFLFDKDLVYLQYIKDKIHITCITYFGCPVIICISDLVKQPERRRGYFQSRNPPNSPSLKIEPSLISMEVED